MEIQNQLENLGFAQKEAKVYLSLLQLGPSTVLAISKRAELKRPTVYLVLEELIKRGYIVIVPGEKKRTYVAFPPSRIKESLEQKKEIMDSLLPKLAAIYNTKSTKPAVKLFEGHEGIKHVYREIVSSGEKEYLSFYSPEEITKKYADPLSLFVKLLTEKPYVKSRELVFTKDENHFYLKATKKLRNHEVRFVSDKTQFFNDNLIWLDKIAIFSFEKAFCMVIQSKDVADSFRSLFELAWQSVLVE